MKRREVKDKGKMEKYIHFNADFQRIEGEIRKPSLVISAKKQRKTIECEKIEISSRKLERPKGTFHAKMGMIKDRNNKEITEAEGIKERWQEYTEELYKKRS